MVARRVAEQSFVRPKPVHTRELAGSSASACLAAAVFAALDREAAPVDLMRTSDEASVQGLGCEQEEKSQKGAVYLLVHHS